MKTLNPYKIPLESINLIEASAGTGKSWTVTLLYLRLILEKALTVDQILVVTFTEAATMELRDDVRKRLIEALDALEHPDSDHIKDEYKQISATLAAIPLHRDEAIRRLKLAKLSIDEAAIFTIHGFCQRALSENAFEAGLPFDSELLEDNFELMQQLADDFWRRHFERAPKALLFKLQQQDITPDSLLDSIRLAAGKPYLELCGPEYVLDDQHWTELERSFWTAMQTWREARDELQQLLCNPDREGEYQKNFIKARERVLLEMDYLASLSVMPTTFDAKLLVWLGVREKTTARFASLEHPFFQQCQDFLDLWELLNQGADNYINQIRIELIQYFQKELPKEKQRRGVLSFDDLLLQLQQALQGHPELAGSLRTKFPVALIDEFQDTDPVQYAIFHRIYRQTQDSRTNNEDAKSAVFMVGDPKQAIYGFRGGDIYTYLKAKADIARKKQFTLDTNYRSAPALIDAYNALYAIADMPFRDDQIDYVRVNSGLKGDAGLGEHQHAPLRFWRFIPETNEQKDATGGIAAVKETIADVVAGDVCALLNSYTTVNGRRVSGADVAILVRSHTQADLIKTALNSRGIASVQSGNQSIFNTHEAVEIQWLLSAIIEPQQEDIVRRALTTDMLAYRADDFIRFEQLPEEWENKLASFYQWRQHWLDHGFLPMMRDMMHEESVYQRLLAHDDGERRVTNLLQLVELMHHASRQQSLGMEEVLRWLTLQQQNAANKESELRLESDENLVKIVTIHKSKGLEYPFVYCPFVGLDKVRKQSGLFIFNKDGKACLEVGSPDVEQHKAIKQQEDEAEAARLLYVALTRAKYQCVVVCFPEPIKRNTDTSALGWLLSNGVRIMTGSSKAARENNSLFYQAYQENLEKLASENQGVISLDDLPAYPDDLRYQADVKSINSIAKNFTAKIRKQAQITSFSGLTAGVHDEAPDYDLFFVNPEPIAISQNEFPRGATAGSALHEIYENIDFTAPISGQAAILTNTLEKWGFEAKHENAATELIENSLQATLIDDFCLQQLRHGQRLNEMEFYLPLRRLQIDDLRQILFQHLPQEQQVFRDAANTLYFEQVEGYMKGFIDLIFEHHGRYYLADYKSNTLPDYGPESLLSAMSEAHYYLQYLIYSVALHRYLKKRLPGYDYQKDFGGVFYLFIRGMSKSTDQQGVYFDKPSLALIEALDALFVRESTRELENA